MRMEFSAGGVVYKKQDDRFYFALIKNGYDKWAFPKGRIEKGEKPEIAAIREVSEEIGIKNLKLIQLIKKIDYFYKDNGELIHKFVYFYLIAALQNAELKPQEEEIQEARWFEFEKAKETLDYKKDDVPLLEMAMNLLEGTNEKCQASCQA